MNNQTIWITPEQFKEYQTLRLLIVELSERYGWKGAIEIDTDAHPEVRAAKLAESIKSSDAYTMRQLFKEQEMKNWHP